MSHDMQDTSLESYFNEVKPTLGKRQELVLETIRKLGCPTDLELATYLKLPIRSIGPRRNELMHMGKIKICEKRICAISQRTAYSWRVVE